VAWENACTPKEEGGLGLRDLELQNRCMLMKLIDKLFSRDPAPSKDWVFQQSKVTLPPISGTS
jgi:hypothetical protein